MHLQEIMVLVFIISDSLRGYLFSIDDLYNYMYYDSLQAHFIEGI